MLTFFYLILFLIIATLGMGNKLSHYAEIQNKILARAQSRSAIKDKSKKGQVLKFPSNSGNFLLVVG